MHAVWYEKYGPAEETLVFGEIETPRPGKNEVLVKLAASGVNPSDVKARAGARGPDLPFPKIIPHSDGAGTIVDTAHGVNKSRIGQRVWIFNGAWQRPFGTAAEFIAIKSTHAVPLPDNVPFEVGACLGIPALTAHRAVFANGPVYGKTVLVQGGAGAVGHYAIQLAKYGGAKVVTTVSSPEKAHHAQRAKPDQIINYKTDAVTDAVRDFTKGKGVDRIIEVELGENLENDFEILAPNGGIAVFGSAKEQTPILPAIPFLFKGILIQFLLVYTMPEEARTQAIQDLTSVLEKDILLHTVSKTFPLADTAKAHKAQESGEITGNIIVSIPNER